MANSDLARETAELVSIASSSRSRSLNELVTLAARQVTACSGAAAALWQDGEVVLTAASHPDISRLLDTDLRGGSGPVSAAVATGETVACADTLKEERWPNYAQAALSLGVRCSVTLVYQPGPAAITLSLFGARPRALEADQLPLAELLVAVGGAVVGNASEYDDARRTAWQLQDAAASRAVVDQAKGVLMHALGCTADEALARMRDMSQQHSLKVTEVASKVIDSHQAEAS